jgi:hypothetical protein
VAAVHQGEHGENLTQRRKGAKVKTDGIAAKRRKKRKKENESKITGGISALWGEGNHLLDIGLLT